MNKFSYVVALFAAAAAVLLNVAVADLIGEDDDRKVYHAFACEKDSRYGGTVERTTAGIRVSGNISSNVRIVCPVVRDDMDGGNKSLAGVRWSGAQTTRISCALSARDFRSFLRWQSSTNTNLGGSTSWVESPDGRAALSIECMIPYSSASSVTTFHSYLIQERD